MPINPTTNRKGLLSAEHDARKTLRKKFNWYRTGWRSLEARKGARNTRTAEPIACNARTPNRSIRKSVHTRYTARLTFPILRRNRGNSGRIRIQIITPTADTMPQKSEANGDWGSKSSARPLHTNATITGPMKPSNRGMDSISFSRNRALSVSSICNLNVFEFYALPDQ